MNRTVPLGAKLLILRTHIFPIIDELNAASNASEASGDDVIELFAMGAATLLADDNWISTPKAIRENAAAIGKLIEQRAKDLRLLSERTGTTVLNLLASNVKFDVAPTKAEADRINWIVTANDDDLLMAYKETSDAPGDPGIEALLAEIKRRGIEI